MALAESIRSARDRLGLTQVQLAKLAGVSQTTISEIESGKTQDPSARLLFDLADALNLDARALLTERLDHDQPRPPYHDEEALLLLYRRLTAENRRLLRALSRTMLDLQSNKGHEKAP